MLYNLPFYNDSGEEIPPYGVFRVSGVHMVNSRAIVKAAKPNTYGSQYLHYVNGFTAVANGKTGGCCNAFPCLARYESGTPSIGTLWGPRDDSWILYPQTGGFIVLGPCTTNTVVVDRFPMLAFTGKFDADTDQGNTGTVSVYWQGADTGENITGVYAVSGDFLTTDEVNVSWINERWEAYCRTG